MVLWSLSYLRFSVDLLISYIDVAWVVCFWTCHFSFWFCIYFGDYLVSWFCNQQRFVSRSSLMMHMGRFIVLNKIRYITFFSSYIVLTHATLVFVIMSVLYILIRNIYIERVRNLRKWIDFLFGNILLMFMFVYYMFHLLVELADIFIKYFMHVYIFIYD